MAAINHLERRLKTFCVFIYLFYFYLPKCWLMWEQKWPISGRSLVQGFPPWRFWTKLCHLNYVNFCSRYHCKQKYFRFTNAVVALLHYASSVPFSCSELLSAKFFRLDGARVELVSVTCRTHRWILKVCSGSYSQKQYGHFSNHWGMLLLFISALCNRWYCEVPSFVST